MRCLRQQDTSCADLVALYASIKPKCMWRRGKSRTQAAFRTLTASALLTRRVCLEHNLSPTRLYSCPDTDRRALDSNPPRTICRPASAKSATSQHDNGSSQTPAAGDIQRLCI